MFCESENVGKCLYLFVCFVLRKQPSHVNPTQGVINEAPGVGRKPGGAGVGGTPNRTGSGVGRKSGEAVVGGTSNGTGQRVGRTPGRRVVAGPPTAQDIGLA